MISAATVKELRERTGVGMMDCKRALEQCGGDMEKAIEFLREKGLATAAKKAGRVAKQGIIFGKTIGNRGVLVELNCETDFVAKNDEFLALGTAMAEMALVYSFNNVDALLAMSYKDATVQDALTNLIATIGENMAVRRVAYFDAGANGVLDLYTHGGGRIAVMVQVELGEGAAKNDEIIEAVHDLSLQIVAAKAQFVTSEDVSAETIEKEKQIYRAQALNEGKSEQIVEKMVEGRLRKYFEEICLMDQAFIKDTDITVRKHLENVGKKNATSIVVKNFVRYEIGESLSDAEVQENE